MAVYIKIFRDAENGAFKMQYEDEDGDVITTQGRVDISLGDAIGSDSNPHEIKLREMCVYASDGTTKKTALVLMSDLYDT